MSVSMTGCLDEFVLKAMKTPGHRLHEEVLQSEIEAAFPNLLSLKCADENDAGEPQQENGAAEDVDKHGDSSDDGNDEEAEG